ncbi:MAG: hypothetical protein NXI20_03460 [bacterium]|nr:hypothetical protein [bacterium]
MFKILIVTLLFNFNQTEEFYVVFVKGEILSQNQKIKKNDKLTSIDQLKFKSNQDLAIIIGSKTGKYILTPKNYSQRGESQSNLVYYVKDVMLPVRKSASSRDYQSDYVGFLNDKRFVFTNSLVLPKTEEMDQLGFSYSDGKVTGFDVKDSTFSTSEIPKSTRFLKIYSKEDDQWHLLAKISLKYIPSETLSIQLSGIFSALEDEEYLSGYVEDNFGYLHPRVLKSLRN